MKNNSDSTTARQFGAAAEKTAAAYLQRRGFKILTTNYHTRRGEIDIIAYNMGMLVFIEVKSRRDHKGWNLTDRITRQKQQRIQLAATEYISKHEIPAAGIRFDAILMTATNRDEWFIDHITDAFRIDDHDI